MARTQQVFGKALLGAAFALSVALPLGAAERRADILYNFTGGADGADPSAGLIRDAAGNFYGTAAGGGGGCGCGVVFKLSPLGAETTLYTFTGGNDGSDPATKLVADAAGNLYGTTLFGGAHNFGVVFKLTPAGLETVLHAFAGGKDGQYPIAGMVMGAGNLYGTTDQGGGRSDLGGTVFKVAPDGTETVLHAFSCGSDGCDPQGDLFIDQTGVLYGTTLLGGDAGGGTIFDIPLGRVFSTRHAFDGGANGVAPAGGVIMDGQGVLYGTTSSGGGGSCNCGVVFKLAPHDVLTVLHAFTGAPDARSPGDSLVMDGQGNLFGATETGGRKDRGAVFEVSPDGTETVVHSFAGSPDGKHPQGSLLLYMNKLHGLTAEGGTGGACTYGCGTVYEVKKAK